jgi:D-aminopeptidase
MIRARLRDLGISIGAYPTGDHNAITDVPGILVGHCTVIHDQPSIARTGVTVIIPREGDIYTDHAFAGFHSFNGCGEMTGIHWIDESGLLSSPIAITSTAHVGTVHEALVRHEEKLARKGKTAFPFSLPVVAETYDGWLCDLSAFPLKQEHVFAAIADAKSGPVAEGNVGGGTGMICHDFKGGIGTSSRVIGTKSGSFTIGVLVQSNYGDRALFRVDGVPVGREIDEAYTPAPWQKPPTNRATEGSIIVVVATDAPLLPTQCKRLAQRATVGIARVGSVGYNGSGDLFLAFSTGNHIPSKPEAPVNLRMLPQHHLNELFEGVAEATEEAVLNALTAAETIEGRDGHIVHALPLDELQRVMRKYRGNLP